MALAAQIPDLELFAIAQEQLKQQAAVLGGNVVLACAERFAAVNPAMLIHDQEVTAPEREGDLAGDHLVREFLDREHVRLIESRFGEHLGGEPDESEALRFVVQDGERPYRWTSRGWH